VPALTTAADHLRAGELADGRDELILARAALKPRTPAAAEPATEVCDVCERVPPAWSVPVTGVIVQMLAGVALPGMATPAALLVCPACRPN
jgi:hypothetical protein